MENQIQPNISQPIVQPVEPTIQSPVRSSTNWSKIILFTLLGLIVVAGLILAGIQIGKDQGTNEQPIIVQPTIFPTQVISNPTTILTPSGPTTIPTLPAIVTPTVNPTANWKTYTNSSLGFELKYPPSIQIESESNDQYNKAVIFKGGNVHFEVMLRKNSGNITLDNYYFMDAPISRKTTLAGLLANIYEVPNGYCDGPSCSEPYAAIVTEKDLDLYHISFFGDIQFSEVENQILSTFKFLE